MVHGVLPCGSDLVTVCYLVQVSACHFLHSGVYGQPPHLQDVEGPWPLVRHWIGCRLGEYGTREPAYCDTLVSILCVTEAYVAMLGFAACFALWFS